MARRGSSRSRAAATPISFQQGALRALWLRQVNAGEAERRGGEGGIAGNVRWYHAVLAVNDEREDALAAEDGGRRSLTAALRRESTPAGNPAHDHRMRTMITLYVHDGESFREAESHHVIREAQVLISRRFRAGAPVLSRPKEVRDFLKLRLGNLDYEVFCCFYLDSRSRLIAFEELFRGTVNCAQVHPRDVLRQALNHNATSVIFAHNHPSGGLDPSPADAFITRRLKELLALMDVHVLDHLIVADGRCYSFAEHGEI